MEMKKCLCATYFLNLLNGFYYYYETESELISHCHKNENVLILRSIKRCHLWLKILTL